MVKEEKRITLGMSGKQLGQTFWAMRFSSLTIVMVLGLAYVMNFSGMTISIGQFLAHTGSLFALLSPVHDGSDQASDKEHGAGVRE